MDWTPTVYFVDDDHSVLDSLVTLARTAGYQARGYLSATELLEEPELQEPGCLVIDFKLPRLNGVTLQQRLRERGVSLPAIFISGHINVDSAVAAMKAGAIDVLKKPFETNELLQRIEQCCAEDVRRLKQRRHLQAERKRYETLTRREREVCQLLAEGLSGKQVAARLGISYRTMEKFRANVMRKMEADSLATLTRKAVALGLVPAVVSDDGAAVTQQQREMLN